MTNPQITEAVILVRQGGTTMAVHVPNLMLILTPVINEPPLGVHSVYFTRGTTVEGYEVEATGLADTLTIWAGDDPFERPEIAETAHEVEA